MQAVGQYSHLVGFIGVPNGQVIAELQQRLACLFVNVLHACHSQVNLS